MDAVAAEIGSPEPPAEREDGAAPAEAPALPEPIARALAERIEAHALDLPLLPQMASEVMAATSREDCDARSLADLIRRDQALAAHLLRIANSPLFLARVPIVSLQQAIARLGLTSVRQMALLVMVQARVFLVPGHEAEVRREFSHSLAAALFAQEIARVRRWNVEEAFLGGLLHDLGRPVLMQVLADLQKQFGVVADAGAVAAAIDAEHARVGAELVASWSLPPRLVEIIAHHHRPEAATNCQTAVLVAGLADALSHFALGELSTRPVDEQGIRKHPHLGPLNLYPDELEALLARAPQILETVQALG